MRRKLLLFRWHKKIHVSVSSDMTSFTETGNFEEELNDFLDKIKNEVSEAVVSSNGTYINEGTTEAYIPVNQFVNAMNKYAEIKFLLNKSQLHQLNNEDYVCVGVDQLKKIKKVIELTNGRMESGVRKMMVKFSDGHELVDGLTVAQTIESKAICYFNQHKWDLYCADPFHNTSSLLFSILLLDRIYLRIANQALGDNDVVMSLDEIEKMFDESVTALKCCGIDYLQLKTKQLMTRVDGNDETRLSLTKKYYQIHNDHKHLETIYYFLEAEISMFKENLVVVDDNDVDHVINSLFRAMHNYKYHINDDFKYALDKKIDAIITSKLKLNDVSRAKNQERVLRFLVLYYLVENGKSTYGQVDIDDSIEIAKEKLSQLLASDDFSDKLISIFYEVGNMHLPALLEYGDYELETDYLKHMLLLAHHKLLLSAMSLDKINLDQSIKLLANQIK